MSDAERESVLIESFHSAREIDFPENSELKASMVAEAEASRQELFKKKAEKEAKRKKDCPTINAIYSC